MKKFLAMSCIFLLLLSLTGCSGNITKSSSENICNTMNSKYIDLEIIEKGGTDSIGGWYYIARDKNTNVLYFNTSNGNGISWTAILNSDGTPKLYEE